jgi:hypothetical protein
VSDLPDRRPGAGSDTSLPYFSGAGVKGRAITGLRIGPDCRISQGEVEENRCRNNGNPCNAGLEPNAALFQVSDNPGGRIESKRASSSQQDRMGVLHRINGIQQIGFASPGSRSAHIHGRHGASFTQDHGATRRPPSIGKVSDFYAINIGNGTVQRHVRIETRV